MVRPWILRLLITFHRLWKGARYVELRHVTAPRPKGFSPRRGRFDFVEMHAVFRGLVLPWGFLNFDERSFDQDANSHLHCPFSRARVNLQPFIARKGLHAGRVVCVSD